MPYFRKKPVTVFAEQWFPGNAVEGVVCNPHNDPRNSSAYYVETPHEFQRIYPGWWVVTGIDGGKYPCPTDIFAQIYEAVDDKP